MNTYQEMPILPANRGSNRLYMDPPPSRLLERSPFVEGMNPVLPAASTRMLALSPDPAFHYELLRVLGTSHDQGADVAEVLYAANRIIPGDFESWYGVFRDLALDVRDQAVTAASHRRKSARGAFFRAASYLRAADFFLHGNPDDPRIHEVWRLATACFDEAIARLPQPAERLTLRADGFDVPAIFYRAREWRVPRPTIVMCNGFDGSQEELFHVAGVAALERGFNVLTFEGPGQPTVLREQGLGFITEWERVLRPVMDWCEVSADVDDRAVGLFGYSFGGFLAPRAAAFEPRLAAVACVDGIFDAHEAFASTIAPPLLDLFKQGRAEAFDRATRVAMTGNTSLRWAIEQGCWAFQCDTPFRFLERTRDLTLKNVASRIRCPVLVCDAERDHVFRGQPLALTEALGNRATHHAFTVGDSADAHCQVGASDLMNGVVMDWFEDTLGKVN